MPEINTENVTEPAIMHFVLRFYALALTDAELKGIFESVIDDWEAHHQVVADFWSRSLLGTRRYEGTPYARHANLPLRPEQFDRWLAFCRQAAHETLPAAAAEKVIRLAEHMAESFKAGMFTEFTAPAGPSRGRPAV